MDQTSPAQVEGAPLDETFRSTRRYYRIGQIVPSSNTTMETEIPAMLRAREGIAPERFTFHSARMRMQNVTKEELAAMDSESDRCALELSDAPVDVLGYACLVAIMSMGHGYHRESEKRLRGVAAGNGRDVPVVTSAGALIEGLQHPGGEAGLDRHALHEAADRAGEELHRGGGHRGPGHDLARDSRTTSRSAAAIRWRWSTSRKDLKVEGCRRRRDLGLRADALAGGRSPRSRRGWACPSSPRPSARPTACSSSSASRPSVPNAGTLLSGRY